jgi:hypothetical protein
MVSNSMVPELIKAFTWLAAMLFAFYLLTEDARNRRVGVYYDCTLASFHPDIPPAVKEACRRRHTYEQDSAAIAEQQKLNRPPKNDSTKN